MSSLYSLEPLGIGSMYCESLTSYIVRLSETHCLKFGTLFNDMIAPSLNKEYLSRSIIHGGNRFFDGARALNSVDLNAADLVKVIEYLTSRNDLRYLTLQSWKELLPNRKLLKENLSWCPTCLNDYREKYGCFYYPLLWFLKPVEFCQIHKKKLLNLCPGCVVNIPILHRNSKNGFCPYCDSDLSFDKLLTFSNYKEEFHYQYEENLGELISLSSIYQSKVNKSIISRRLAMIDNKYKKLYLRRLRVDLGIPKATYYDWLRGNVIPTIENQLKICFLLKITLRDFYYENDLKVPLIETENCLRSEKTKRRKLDYSLIKQSLLYYINSPIPLSMESIAKEIGVAKRLLYVNNGLKLPNFNGNKFPNISAS